jgi:hypothetical protein
MKSQSAATAISEMYLISSLDKSPVSKISLIVVPFVASLISLSSLCKYSSFLSCTLPTVIT